MRRARILSGFINGGKKGTLESPAIEPNANRSSNHGSAWSISDLGEGNFTATIKIQRLAGDSAVIEILSWIEHIRSIQQTMPDAPEKALEGAVKVYKASMAEIFGALIKKYQRLSNCLKQLWTLMILGKIVAEPRVKDDSIEILCRSFNPNVPISLDVSQLRRDQTLCEVL